MRLQRAYGLPISDKVVKASIFSSIFLAHVSFLTYPRCMRNFDRGDRYGKNFLKETHLEMFTKMERIREFDSRINKIGSSGSLFMWMTHFSVGEEAANVGLFNT